MKIKRSYAILLVFLFNLSLTAQERKEIQIPDLNGFITLKCDFHMHTVFSDGLVWPTIRVKEAYMEGLDAIAITDHIEYTPHKDDLKASFNRSYELMKDDAARLNILLIHGSEITRSMPPGHFNALFLENSDSLKQKDYMDAFKQAALQKAFFIWNHPGWGAQQPDTTKWFPIHTELLTKGYMQGIELVNSNEYYPEAHRWALEKNLTVICASDIHEPIHMEYDIRNGHHRPMTLVFAKNKSNEALREALEQHRTLAYFNQQIIGDEKYVKPMFEKIFEVSNVTKTDKKFVFKVKNNSDIPLILEKTAHDPNLVYFRQLEIAPHSQESITIKLLKPVSKIAIDFKVNNFMSQPDQGMQYSLKLE